MASEVEIKQRVRHFYDQVGWQTTGDGLYQNARYEDLRPVSRDYIRRCHLRVNRFLKPQGRYLLDAGSGPVQYPEYLTYSEGYEYRVCADISIVALQEARSRLGRHGLYVVADVANLPFKTEPFDGIVSLHTLHHLPLDEQVKAYDEIYRVLKPGSSAVIVNGWTDSPLMRRLNWLVRGMERVGSAVVRLRGRKPDAAPAAEKADQKTGQAAAAVQSTAAVQNTAEKKDATGTFVRKFDAAWLREQIGGKMKYEIYSWRSVSVRFLRAVIHDVTGGRLWLRLLFGLENRWPRFFGEKGQYPLIVIRKDSSVL
ncbi:MAG: class I SAM-dependent methyltransferase [Chloroflexi bacterium]|nr:class I SAM-dependent methyltransferase [Chloroflexota bacterium]